jgi:transposase-like protein
MALLKLIYLATQRIEKKWNALLQNWGLVVQQLAIKFEGRLELDLATNKTKS